MADTISSASVLNNILAFDDGETRTVNIDNPKTNLTKAEVEDWFNHAKNNNLLLSEKGGASLAGIKTSQALDRTQTVLDLNL